MLHPRRWVSTLPLPHLFALHQSPRPTKIRCIIFFKSRRLVKFYFTAMICSWTKGIITHATTNLNADELEDIYGIRVRSRLRSMFNLVSFPMSVPDKRKWIIRWIPAFRRGLIWFHFLRAQRINGNDFSFSERFAPFLGINRAIKLLNYLTMIWQLN
jgi:hypothetical protein